MSTKILSCNSNRPLADAISKYMELPLTKADVRRFSDMEVFVEIQENVRGEDVFIIQSTSSPTNDNLMELLVALDALKRGSANRITAVIPYYGYARQDRKSGPRTPISAIYMLARFKVFLTSQLIIFLQPRYFNPTSKKNMVISHLL